MGTSAVQKRQKLFEVNSAGIVALGVGKPDTFVCPLCVKVFTKNDLKPIDTPKGPQFRLTLAHIIPEALGGRLCTLACKDCNNGVGKSLEAALKEQFVLEDAVKDTRSSTRKWRAAFGEWTKVTRWHKWAKRVSARPGDRDRRSPGGLAGSQRAAAT